MPVSGGHARGRHVGPRLKPVPPVSRPVVPSDRPGISWIKHQRERSVKSSQVKSSQGSVSHTEVIMNLDDSSRFTTMQFTTSTCGYEYPVSTISGALFIYTSRICRHLISSSQFVMRGRPTASPPGRSRRCLWRPRRRHGHSLRALPL